jgi:hypothetical protein
MRHFSVGAEGTATGHGFVPVRFGERTVQVYSNANLSILLRPDLQRALSHFV